MTAISGNIGNGILKILKSQQAVLYGCDVNEIAVGMDLVQEFWQCKYAVENGYIDELLEKCATYKVTHLIPVNEREIEVIGKERDSFENIGVKLVLQSQNVLDICLDKYNTAEFLKNNGFDIPAYFSGESVLQFMEWGKGKKYICKPRKSNGSKDIFVFSSRDNLTDKIGKDCIVQEYIESDEEYTVGVFQYKNITNTIAFLRKLQNGYTSQVELVEDEEIKRIALKAARLFKLEGYINIQLRKREGKYYIFEINPRISGTVRFRHLLGYTDVLWWLEMLDGKEIKPYCKSYSRALGVRELNEKYLILE